MKRITATVAVLGLLVAACGGGDESPASAPADEPTEEQPSNGDEPAADEPAADDSTDGDSPLVEPDGGGGNDSSGSIRSMNDVPEVCREVMANFLRNVEPIVESVDWQTATLADFEAISTDFEAVSDEFDLSSGSIGCNDLEFVDDNETELLIEFAKSEAPGTVEFLEFISDLTSNLPTGNDGGSAGGGALETCTDAIAFVQELQNTYDSFAEVPAADLLKFGGLASVLGTCTPEQVEFFDGDEFNAFFDE